MEKAFPMPGEVKVPPELEGWEEMYYPAALFQKEREEYDNKFFWVRDMLHGPYPIYPFDQIVPEAWTELIGHWSMRVLCVPLAGGWGYRVLGGYFYTSASPAPPEEIVKKRLEIFQRRTLPKMINYGPEAFEKWLNKVRECASEIRAIEFPERLPESEPDELMVPEYAKYGCDIIVKVTAAFHKLVELIFAGWQFHSEYLGPTYLAYLNFMDVCRKIFPGIPDVAIGKMVAGVRTYVTRPQEELARLSKLAYENPRVTEILETNMPVEEKIKKLKGFKEGEEWLDEYKKVEDPWFYVPATGFGHTHEPGAWKDLPEVPFGHIRGYLGDLKKGVKLERDLEAIERERERVIAGYRQLIKTDENRKAFDEALAGVKKIYSFAEDHVFWTEYWLYTIQWDKVKELGRLLANHGVIKEMEDIFYLNRFEVEMALEDLTSSYGFALDCPPLGKLWQEKVEKRKRIMEAARKWTPPVALGTAPKEITDPFFVNNYGITTETVKEWLEAAAVKPEEVSEIKGIAASSGVSEGYANVIISVEDLDNVESGQILVTRWTDPSWSAVFSRIKGTVTDIGGLNTHAAIISREYGLPAVVATGTGTTVIKTGDYIRVDGENGVVTILKRA